MSAFGGKVVDKMKVRTAAPEADNEGDLGDAGAAVRLGRDSVLAEWLGAHSVSAEMLDEWRTADDPFVRNADSKFCMASSNLRSTS